jgi:hypothetical protein
MLAHSLLGIGGFLFPGRVYSTRQDLAASEGKDKMQRVSGLEVILRGCLVVGPLEEKSESFLLV